MTNLDEKKRKNLPIFKLWIHRKNIPKLDVHFSRKRLLQTVAPILISSIIDRYLQRMRKVRPMHISISAAYIVRVLWARKALMINTVLYTVRLDEISFDWYEFPTTVKMRNAREQNHFAYFIADECNNDVIRIVSYSSSYASISRQSGDLCITFWLSELKLMTMFWQYEPPSNRIILQRAICQILNTRNWKLS